MRVSSSLPIFSDNSLEDFMHVDLAELVSSGTEYALKVIKWRYEKILPFHNTGHTISVIKRAETLGRAMELSEKDVNIVKLISAFHDIAWWWSPDFSNSDKITRKPWEFNESASLDELILWFNKTRKAEISVLDGKLTEDALMSTVVNWDFTNNTVFQPNLKFDSHPIVRCVALADLGSAGMDAKYFIKEGDLRFREVEIDIDHAITKSERRSDIDSADQKKYRERMLKWSYSQKLFAIGRKSLRERELGNLNKSTKDIIRLILNKFDESIDLTNMVIARRQDQDFWSIAHHMGYHIPN